MPSIIDINPETYLARRRLVSAGASRPGALESLIWVNGLTLNDQMSPEQYYVKSVDGLWGTEIRDQREPKVNDDGEDVYDTLLSGKLVTISGHIDAHSLDRMRDMEQDLETAFPHDYDYPIIFDRSALRQTGIARGDANDRNWCINPSVEVDLMNWLVFGTNIIARETSNYSKYGSYYASIFVQDNTSVLRVNTTVAVPALSYFQVAIDVFIPDDWSGGDITISDGALNGGATLIPERSNQSPDLTLRNRWQRIWATYQRDNTDGTTAHLLVTIPSVPVSGNLLRFDGVTTRVTTGMPAVSTPTYFDGESPGWDWIGALHASSSIPDLAAYRQNVFIQARRIDKIGLRDEQTNQWYKREYQVPLRMSDPCIYSIVTKTLSNPDRIVNLVPNPSYEVDGTGWASAVITGITYNTFAVQTTWAQFGAKSLRLTATKDSNTTSRFIVVQTPGVAPGIPVLPNTTYTLSAYVNVLDPTAAGPNVRIDWYDAGGANISGASGANVGAGVAGVVRPFVTATSPANASFAQIKIQTNTNVSADIFDAYIDGVMLTASATVLPYFDGSVGGATYWSGTAHNSPSSVLQPIYAKNHGNYKAKPRLLITGPWTNFGITNTVLMPGESITRKFSFTGVLAAGVTATWDEETNRLIDSTGVSRDGWVDPAANGLRLGPECTSILTLAGTGLSSQSDVQLAWEDTWK